MAITLFELVMGWVFLAALGLGLVTFIVGLRQKERDRKLLHFAVASALPLGAWVILMAGSALGIP
ncbi:hypothetical protein [Erythrobacter sp. THAF29]|uniref:hypothetical protein n=1 Tax=Erythrobacter sp. THAF29 TaxID=2587851 RepID=UPI0012681D23|nr:hypothetical protein [Erythrobacter sp. THAF29]QFT78098.1 hypothetical protein FIU90_11165 [Erythrobacter sp. THAF29]